MNICTKFECEYIKIEKIRNYGILMPKDSVGEIYCCIPLVDGMKLNMKNHTGTVAGKYEIFFREVKPRGNMGVIRLPKEYMSCDAIILK